MPIPSVDFSAYQQARRAQNWGTSATGSINNFVEAVETATNEIVTQTNTNTDAITALQLSTSDGLNNTSASSQTVGSGTKTFTVSIARSYVVGAFLVGAKTTDPTNFYIHGQVTAWNSTTKVLQMNVNDFVGSGSVTDWTFSGSSPQGPSGSSTMDITGLTNEPSTASGDEWAFYDVSAAANRKINRTDLSTAIFNIGTLSVLSGSVANDDYLPIQDTSAAGRRKIAYQDLIAPIMGLIIALG